MGQTGVMIRRDDALGAIRKRIEKMRKANIGMMAISERTKESIREIVEADEIHDIMEGATW